MIVSKDSNLIRHDKNNRHAQTMRNKAGKKTVDLLSLEPITHRPISRNKKGLALVHVLIITLFLVALIVVFIAMVQNANIKEFKILRTNVDVVNAEGVWDLLKTSLETSWRVISTQTVFSGLEERFGLPKYFYNYTASTALPSQLADGCTDDERLCLLTTAYATAKLTELISSVELPSSFNMFVRLGRGLLEFDRTVGLTISGKELLIAADRVHGVVDQMVSIGGPTSTSIAAQYVIRPEITTGLKNLLLAASQSVNAAIALRSRAGSMSYTTRGKTAGTLQDLFELNFESVRDAAGTVKASYRLTPTFESDGNALLLGYDTAVRLNEDEQTIVSGLANSSLQECLALKTRLYNRYAGTIERAQPDVLLDWVEEPRALMAALAEELGNWNPTTATLDESGSHNGLFGVLGGSIGTNAEEAVDALIAAFKSNATLHEALVVYLNASDGRAWNIINSYDAWLPCITASSNESTALNPRSIFGPQDYALFLEDKTLTSTSVTVGDSFCSASDYGLRGYRKLSYDFYASAEQWPVWPAYPGTIIKREEKSTAFEGCGGAVWVKTGDFIVVYGHINPLTSAYEGKAVTLNDRLGHVYTLGVSSMHAQKCDGKLTVMILAPEWTVPEPVPGEFSACGARISNTPIIAGEQVSPGDVKASTNTDFPSVHMAALEWDVLFRRRVQDEGRYWQLRERNEWERAPIAIDFKMRDSFPIIDCSADGRYEWQNENDLLCYNGELWSCVNELAGANIATGGIVGNHNCVARNFPITGISVPPFIKTKNYIAQAYVSFVAGKRITKWCTDAERNSDWLCCVGSGGTHSCPNDNYVFDGKALVCESGGLCSPLAG